MDLKSILLQSEDSLPTLERAMSTGTTSPPSLPGITADPSTYWKFGGSTVIGIAGMMFLRYGKKNGDVEKMLIGAALTIGSIFIF